MIVHKDPRVNSTFPTCNSSTHFFEKLDLIPVISEYDGFIDSPHPYVMERSGCIQPRLSWLALIIFISSSLVKTFAP